MPADRWLKSQDAWQKILRRGEPQHPYMYPRRDGTIQNLKVLQVSGAVGGMEKNIPLITDDQFRTRKTLYVVSTCTFHSLSFHSLSINTVQER